MKIRLNVHLLSTLPRVVRMTHNEVAKASGISIACWYRLVKDPNKITVQQLLGLANGLHIPVSRFFSSGKTDIIGVREDYIMTANYQNCYYDSDAIRQRIGKGTATSWNDAASAVGMHWTNVSSSLLAVSRTPMARLISLCETFGFGLFDFLVDPNKETQKGVTRDARTEIEGLREEIRALAATVSNLAEKYERLEKENERLRILFEMKTAARNIPLDVAAEPND